MRYKLDIQYDGTDFKGWQKQPKQRTVQGEIERALDIIFQKPIPVNGSGRTDAGVHATHQIAHFDIDESFSIEKVKQSLNRLCGKDIIINKLVKTKATFDSRFDATERSYRYYVSEKPIAINRQFIYSYYRKVDLDQLNAYAKHLIGEHDFTTFSKTNSDVEHYRSIVYNAEWIRSKGCVVFEISAIRFLRGMVRAIVGMSLQFEKQMKPESEFKRILEAQDRKHAPFYAPPEGLVLTHVGYKKR